MTTKDTTSKTAATTGIFAALAASSCCIPPVIAAIAGIGGISSSLSWVEPLRPYLVGVAVLAIGYAWFTHLKPKKADDCACDIDAKPKWYQSRGFLVGITLFAAISISFPYYAHLFYPKQEKQIIVVDEANVQQVEFSIKGMTCKACAAHVESDVSKLPGILSVSASYENGNALVEYDNSSVDVKRIEATINATGYTVNDKNEK